MIHRRLRPHRLLAILSTSALIAACGAQGPTSELPGPDGSDDTTVEDPFDDGAKDDSNGGFTGDNGNDATSSGGGVDGCAESSSEAKMIPVTMFITVDKSGSMDNDNKWTNAKSAFTAFFQDPEADGLNVALRFWPDDGGGCDKDVCNVNACATPDVAVGSLADTNHEVALVNEFNATNPDGPTPMSAALAGATQWAASHQPGQEGAEQVVVVLLTDGSPNGCQEDITDISSYASDAYANNNIMTFAVGLEGSNENDMNNIAQAGGTQSGFFIGNGNAQADLLAALKAIQETAVSCVFAMPESDDVSSPVDPGKVNVTYTEGGGTDAQTINQVDSADACGSSGGWHYDDPSNPTVISLCQNTCDAIQSDTAGSVKIVLGCKTEVL